MACIIKIPSEYSKGVVTFTTQERDKFIFPNSELQSKIKKLKNKWVIGLHHNWHDFNFEYNSLFDFSMAGETDLIEKNGNNVPLIPLDACNFSPSAFHFSKNEKFWDILYVGRAVYFKKIPEFFDIVRSLYDEGKMYRVLLISPIPSECKENPNCKTAFCDIRSMYDQMFTQKEQDLFTLLTIDYRSPFPFDISTLAYFYRSSKIFVHSADDERRCRVAGYAWATGMPVVCMEAVASLLPKEKQLKPYLYLAKTYQDFPGLIDEALHFVNTNEYTESKMKTSISETSVMYTVNVLVENLARFCSENNERDDMSFFNLNELDIRLGRHFGMGDTVNTIGWSLNSFVNYLGSQDEKSLKYDISISDVERYITQYTQFGQFEAKSLFVEKNKLISQLKKQKLLRWLKKYLVR
jgi:glycosyltransferase involved in cell wall biosynthesis